MTTIEFYDVKTRKKVTLDASRVLKTTFNTNDGQVRYALRARTDDGRSLTRFVSKFDWDRMKITVEK